MPKTALTSAQVPLLLRFLNKLVLEVLPAGLASVIGGFLFTQYQFGHTGALRAATEQASPASAEMMRLFHDEHAMILDYLDTQRAAEKRRLAVAEQEDASAEANAKMAAEPIRRAAAAVVPSKPTPRRSKPVAVAAVVAAPPPSPPVIARVEQNDAAALAEPVARNRESIVDRTIAIKDHVFSATLHAVSTIGGIPSWIGHRLGDDNAGSADASLSAAS
jgi:hypothetical protein